MYFILKTMLNLFTSCKKSEYIHCLVCILLTFTFHLEGNSLLRNRKIHSTYLKLWLFWYSWGKCLFRTKVSPSNRKSLILSLKALRVAIYNPTLEFGGTNVALRLLTFEKLVGFFNDTDAEIQGENDTKIVLQNRTNSFIMAALKIFV